VSRADEHRARVTRRIPGGAQLLSKRPDEFLPGAWPPAYRRARGARVEDLDGRSFVDVTLHGVGACPLGYADPDVDRAVVEAVHAGVASTLNVPEEVALADLLCELHPWAEQVRYTRSGGEAMAVAVRLARAATGRDVVAFCGYHGWHDWYLAANLGDTSALDGHLLPHIEPLGVPRALTGTALPFPDADPAALDRLLAEHGSRLAAIVMEPARYRLPPPGWLEHVRAAAARVGAVFVLDEITSGFRMTVGGLHLQLGVEPDLAVFAKGMSNGYAMAAVIGREEVMEVAGRCFVSSTSWSERVGPAAALATIRKLRECDVPKHLCAAGARMRRGWEERAQEHGLDITTRGLPPLPLFTFAEEDEERPLASLYVQGMLDRGFLASGAFYASWAHVPEVVDAALEATAATFAELREALDRGEVKGRLRGPAARHGLRGSGR